MSAVWKWQGINKEGKRVSGHEKVKNDRELKRILRSKGIRPTKLTPPSIFDLDLASFLVEKGFAKPFGRQELLNFTKQLSVMISAGVPILQALEILFKQERNSVLKVSIKKIASDVGSGKSLSEAMSSQKGFDRLYCNLIQAGEVGGVLDTILNKLTTYMEKQEKILSQIKSAMTYPMIVIVVGIAVVYLMLVFVVPKFTDMLKESNQQVPDITQFVINASNFLQTWTPTLVPVTIVGFIIGSWWIKTDEGKPIWDKLTMNMPIFGSIVIKGNLSSFSRTLSTMLGAGVSLIDALDICRNTMDNVIMARDVAKIKKAVAEGKTLAEPISQIKYFPEMVAHMVKVGEQTGEIDQMLERISGIYEREVEESIATATKLIEPIILVGLGGIIAVILVAMYMPIFMSAGGSF